VLIITPALPFSSIRLSQLYKIHTQSIHYVEFNAKMPKKSTPVFFLLTFLVNITVF